MTLRQRDKFDPFYLFDVWYKKAQKAEPNDPNAMALATVDLAGKPSVRMVLLKGVGPQGFSFYTNLESQKGRELAQNPQVALLFHWKSLRRQIRIEGKAQPVPDNVADTYFASRNKKSQIGAWASQQSRLLESRFDLKKQVAKYSLQYGLGTVPRPQHWSGFTVKPERFEFWRDRVSRLHERRIYQRGENGWHHHLLYP